MIVDLEDREQIGAFDLEGGGKVTIRLMTEKDINEIRAACVKPVVEFPLLDGEYRRFESQAINHEQMAAMRIDRNIVGWELLFDRNENPIPVTLENKVLLMKKSELFRKAVEKGLKALKKAEEDGLKAEKVKAKALEKN